MMKNFKFAINSALLACTCMSGLAILPATAQAQEFVDEYKRELYEQIQSWMEQNRPEINFPQVAIEQQFACGVVRNGTASPLVHELTFNRSSSLDLQITLDNHQTIQGNGSYYGIFGLTGFDINLNYTNPQTGGVVNGEFRISSVQFTRWENTIRYFDANGEYEENGTIYQTQVHCQAVGHGYNVSTTFQRFVCPARGDATGSHENVFVFNSVNGNAFRQHDYTLYTSTSPLSSEVSNFGLFVQNGNSVLLDFNVNPVLSGILPTFSDFNQLSGQIAQNPNTGQPELTVNEFPQGFNICSLS